MIAGADIKAVEGRDGWLFLAEVGGIPVLDAFRDLTPWRRSTLPKLVASFRARAKRMAGRGIPFLVVLAPEATGVYADKLPGGIAIERPTMAEHLACALRAEGVDVVCPAARMRAARGALDLYRRHDSHWSDFGASLCYRDLLDWLVRKDLAAPDHGVGWRAMRFSIRTSFGDLGVRMTPERSEPLHHVGIPALAADAGANVFDDRANNVRRNTSPHGRGRALVFRDSFARALSPFLDRTFAETILVGGSPAMPDDAIAHFAPDLVILEVAERSLLVEQAPFADWPAGTFAQSHFERATNAAGGTLQVQSRAALRERRIHEAVAAAAVAVCLEGADARLHNLAHALLVAGHGDPAMLKLGDLLCRSLSPQRDDPTLHALHGQFAFMQGRVGEAREAIARALAAQPEHAQYLYSSAVWDYLAGDFTAALATIRRSLEGAPLHADSWRIAIACAKVTSDPILPALEAEAQETLPGFTPDLEP